MNKKWDRLIAILRCALTVLVVLWFVVSEVGSWIGVPRILGLPGISAVVATTVFFMIGVQAAFSLFFSGKLRSLFRGTEMRDPSRMGKSLDKVLGFLIRDDGQVEEIVGSLIEESLIKEARHGPRYARWWFVFWSTVIVVSSAINALPGKATLDKIIGLLDRPSKG